MLSHDKNALLTRTGPGTPMGRMMRCFWIPALLEREVPPADEPPVRLTLLGERLIVFRDSEGRVGVLEEHCPHRSASLFFGRNEAGGIRCVYHGWKFGVDGACLDLPTEPAGSRMQATIRAGAYPARLAGGVLWVYMGEASSAPELPDFEFIGLPASHVYASRWTQQCNFVQAMEGEFDTAHVGFLHSVLEGEAADKRALTGRYFREDMSPKWKIMQTDAGFIAGGGRRVEGGEQRYWRLNQFLLPFYSMIPPRPDDAKMVRMWVPTTDETMSIVCVSFRPEAPLGETELAAWRNGENTHRKVIPGTTTPEARLDNDYLIDRAMQKTRTFTGIQGIRAQDAMVCETPGPIVDRSKEHLGSTDVAVLALRRRLMEAAAAMEAEGTMPEAAARPWAYRVRATQSVLPEGVDPETSEVLMGPAKAAPQRAAEGA